MPAKTSRQNKNLPALLVALIVGVPGFILLAHQEINHDTGWFMYAARGMLAGGTLYRDFIDVNAPMAYLSLIPAAWLSNFSFFTNDAALAVNIFIYIGAAYFLCAALMRELEISARAYAAVCAGFLCVMIFMPNYGFGQREHILGILTLPYALSAALRVEKKNLPRNLAIASGIAAGFAASIKVPYIIVFAAIEAAVLLRGRKIVFAPDNLAFAISFALINIICIVLYPYYWTKILPSAMKLYEPYNNFWFLTDALIILTPLFCVSFGAGEYRGKGALIAARWTMVAATLGGLALFIIQQKGWPHHAVPIMITLGAMIILNLADIVEQFKENKTIGSLRGGVSVAMLAASFYLAHVSGNVDTGLTANMKENLKGTDGSYYIISTGNYPAFPLGLDRRYKWTSRFPQLILLPGLAQMQLDGNKFTEWEPWFRNAVLEDLKRGHPARVFLYVPQDAGMPPDFDMLQWLRQDPYFEDEWRAHYRQIGVSDPFAVFGRQ